MFSLGMDNLEMLISIYKNWPNDDYVGDSSSFMDKFMEMEEALINENEDVIASFEFLDMNENKYKV
jgi:hypothetical protein